MSETDKSKKRKKAEENEGEEALTKYIQTEAADWRDDLSDAEKLMGEIVLALKFSGGRNRLGSLLEDQIELFDGLNHVTPEELSEAFETAVQNYLMLAQPK